MKRPGSTKQEEIWFKADDLKNRIAAPAPVSSEPIAAIVHRFGISNREKEILAFILKGKNNREIEQSLFLSAGTIRNSISALYGNIGINGRGQLMNLVLKMQTGEY